MKMATWRQLFRATSDQIGDNERRIDRQRQFIAELAQDGQDTVLAEQELTVLMENNELLRETRQRLLDKKPGAQQLLQA